MNLSRLIPLAAVLDIKRLRDEGLSWAKLAEAAAALHPDVFAGLSQTQGMAKCRCAYKRKYTTAAAQKPAVKAKTSQPPAKAVKPAKAAKEEPGLDVQLQTLLKGGTAMEDIAAQMGITLRVAQAMVADLKDSGYNVLESGGQYKLSKISPPTINKVVENWSGEKIIRFGLISDTHINCKWTQLSFLHELYARFAREGIPIVYHAGDLDDGEKMHPGHEYEIYSHGADAHIAEIIRVYPRHDGLITKFITGNHDSSYIKQIGMNIGIPVAAARPDMIYLGIDSAVIGLTERCTLELSHPGDGSCFDDETEILTKRGWLLFKDLRQEDWAATMTKQGHIFQWQQPDEITALDYKGAMYHFKARTLDLRVTPNHGMWTKISDARKPKQRELKFPQKSHPSVDYSYRRVTAQEMAQGYVRQKWQMTNCCETWEGSRPNDLIVVPFVASKNKGMDERMKHIGAIPYLQMARLMAWYVTEGYADSKRVIICQSRRANPGNHAEIRALLSSLGITHSVGGRDDKDITIGSVELAQYLKAECGRGSRNVRLPAWIKELPAEELRQVLDVLIKADGWNRKPSGFGYKSLSDRLRDDVSEIAIKCGYAVSEHKDTLCLTDVQKYPTVNTAPEISAYEGKVYCCRVDNGLILVRRNGKATWSHNSYAISYKTQKRIDAMSGGEKPNLLAVGHYHKSEILPMYRNVHAIQAGTVCAQTPWMRGKGLAAHVGGWIIEIHVQDDGSIKELVPRFFPCYKTITDDYKNFR